ncbi:MAG: VOC family protein [Bacteroidetes bacterium]|nr:VOC family protein [Bacteroidota bacterium]
MKVEKQQTGGIIFFQTKKIDELADFYINQVGCKLWLDQGGCQIFQFENMLFGFCQRDQVDDKGMITFYYSSRDAVDIMYQKFKTIAVDKPKDNPDYRIYHFFAKDPDGRNIEFQYFWDN